MLELVSAAAKDGPAAVPSLEASLAVPVTSFVRLLVYVVMYLLVFLRQSALWTKLASISLRSLGCL